LMPFKEAQAKAALARFQMLPWVMPPPPTMSLHMDALGGMLANALPIPYKMALINLAVNQKKCANVCEMIESNLQIQLSNLRERYNQMLADKNDLYCKMPTGKQSWASHQQAYNELQNNLKKLYNLAVTNNCTIDSDVIKWKSKPPPQCPT
jgi:hypothetical protein